MWAEELVPAGFEDLSTEEHSPIELYYNGNYLGSFLSTFDDDYLIFDNPQAVLKEMTFIQNNKIIQEELQKPLNPNLDKVCYDLDKKKCPIINPDKIGIILDRNKYKAELIVNYKYLQPAKLPETKYYSNSSSTWGVASKNSMFFKNLYKPQHRESLSNIIINNYTTLSKQHFNLNILTTYAKRFDDDSSKYVSNGIKIQDAFGSYTKGNHSVSFGTINSEGSFLIPSQNVLGIKVKTDNSLVENPHSLHGTPISINVNEPSVVEVFKDNIIIYSMYYNPGNYYVDTRSFPEGVYNIKIKINTLYGKSSSKLKLFVKKTDFPALGKSNYELLIGIAPDQKGLAQPRVIPTYDNKRLVNKIFYNRRISKLYNISTSLLSDLDYSILGVEVTKFGQFYQLSLGGVIASDGGVGGSFLGNINNNGSFSLSFSARYIYDKNKNLDNIEYLNPLDLLQQTQMNYSLSMLYKFKKNNIRFNYNYNNYSLLKKDFSYELNFNRPLYTGGKINSEFTTNVSWSNTGFAFYVSINARLESGKTQQILKVSKNKTEEQAAGKNSIDYNLRYRPLQSIAMESSINAATDGDNTITTQLEYLPYNAKVQFARHKSNNNSPAYLINSSINSDWGGTFSPKNGFGFTNEIPYNSGVLVNVKSDRDSEDFIVYINSAEYKIKSNNNYFFSLAPYKKYKFSITTETQNHLYRIADIPDVVMLYNNNIQAINARAIEYYVIITKIFDDNNILIKNAKIYTQNDYPDEIDEDGEGQFEAAPGDKLTVELENMQKCQVEIPENLNVDDGIVFLDSLACSLQ